MMSKKVFGCIVALLFLGILICSAQTKNIEDYRWTTIGAKGDVTERHESSMVLFDDKFPIKLTFKIKNYNCISAGTSQDKFGAPLA